MNADAVPATCGGCEDIAAAPAFGKTTPQPNIITMIPAVTVHRFSAPASCTPASHATPVSEIPMPMTIRWFESLRSIMSMFVWFPARSASVPAANSSE